MNKIGAFTGKFYPPHIGHLYAIDYSLSKCSELYVFISENEERELK
jgi:cytidyltransferase-like protein